MNQKITIDILKDEKVSIFVLRNKSIKRFTIGVLILIGLISIPFLIGTTAIASIIKQKIVCSQFSTHLSAQMAYDDNPIKYKSLDKNHDGVACSSLK